MRGKNEAIRPFTIHHSIRGQFAIRKGYWKLILTDDNGGGWDLLWETPKTKANIVQLYNLKNDPGETRNLEEGHPEIIKELVDDLTQALHRGRTTPGKPQSNDGWPYQDQETRAQYPQLNP